MSKNDNPSIDQQLTELARLVEWFEGDEFSIEKATEQFAKAEALAKHIEVNLAELKNTVTVLKQDFSRE